MIDDNTLYVVFATRWLDVLGLTVIGMALGAARGAYSSKNGDTKTRMLKHGVLGACAALLWTLALFIDSTPAKGEVEAIRIIPFGPVINFAILIVISLWADDLLTALVGAAGKITNTIQKRLIDKFFPNGDK